MRGDCCERCAEPSALRLPVRLLQDLPLLLQDLPRRHPFDGAAPLDPGLGALAAAGAVLLHGRAAVTVTVLEEALAAGGADAAGVLPLLGEALLGLLHLPLDARDPRLVAARREVPRRTDRLQGGRDVLGPRLHGARRGVLGLVGGAGGE